MKKPQLKSNLIQSYIDFPTRVGKLRFGSEENRLFVEINEEKIYLTDASMNFLIEKALTITGDLSVDNLIEKTSAAGIIIDGLTIKDGVSGKITAHAATSDGLLTGQLIGANQFVVVTVTTNADDIISLPKASTTPIGTVITGMIAATGFELRVHPDDAAAAKINDITTNVEAAIPADTSFKVELISATEWILTATTKLGAVLTAIVPDAVV